MVGFYIERWIYHFTFGARHFSADSRPPHTKHGVILQAVSDSNEKTTPAPPSSWPPSSVHCLLLSPSLPPCSHPPVRARQADHLTTNTTATGPSPSNVKPGWNVALTIQTHGKEGECGSLKWRGGRVWRERERATGVLQMKNTPRWNWKGGRSKSGNDKNHLRCEWKSHWERLRLFLMTPPTSTLHCLRSVNLSDSHLGLECAIFSYRHDHYRLGHQCRCRRSQEGGKR